MKPGELNLRRRGIVDIFVTFFIMIIPFIVSQLGPGYLLHLPKIDPNIFEQLSQINATILGLTLVGIFYYLGKLDDRKRDYVNNFPALVKYFVDYAATTENLFSI